MYFCYRVTSKAEERPCGSGRGFRSNCLFWAASSKETPARSSLWPSSCSPRFASASNQPKYTRESTNCGFKVRFMRFEIIQLSTEKARLSTVYHLKIVKVYQINTLWHIARLVEYQCSESCAGAGRARLCEPLPSDGTCAACPATTQHTAPH